MSREHHKYKPKPQHIIVARAKWIGGFLGLLSGGPIGALAGFVLGSLIDTVIDTGIEPVKGNYNGEAYDDSVYDTISGNSRRRSGADGDRQGVDEGARNGFLFSLLTLASYIIRADGRVMHSEMEAVRQFLRANFGEIAVAQGEQIVLRLLERQKIEDAASPGAYRSTIIECCHQLRDYVPEAQRLQILGLLAMLAKADGRVATEEVNALREVTLALGLSEAELNSMLNLGSTTLDEAYAVLEVSPEATDAEVRAAYKRMAVKHHPDRVAALGDDVRAAAEKKMKQINEARDIIYKARGM